MRPRQYRIETIDFKNPTPGCRFDFSARGWLQLIKLAQGLDPNSENRLTLFQAGFFTKTSPYCRSWS